MSLASVTRTAPHVRAARNSERLQLWFLIASLPAAGAGLWLQPEALGPFGLRLMAVWLTGAAWELWFSRLRQRPMDIAWLVQGWLLALLVPVDVPLPLVAVAMSFGMVIGHHVFGGAGRSPVNPALLGALFLQFGYPEVAASAGLGSASWLACAVGGACLVWVGAASIRVPLGIVIGVMVTATLQNLNTGLADHPDGWRPPDGMTHLLMGQLMFCSAFIATDPGSAALTRVARWLHGLLLGTLTVLLRVLDPTHPDGVLYATLLAGLTVPLLDHVAVRRAIRAVAALATRDGAT
ncbi:MAG: RnfABCDGE type electron transport complex subunit D [Pseudomonadales bacterium]